MKARVLIVDNDTQLNKINEKILLSSGVVSEVHISRSSLEALQYLIMRDERGYPLPNVIVMEILLPGMNGFEFADAFARLPICGKHRIELVAFTSSSNPKDREKAMAKGFKHFLSKPYLLRGLRDVIAHMRTTDTHVPLAGY